MDEQEAKTLQEKKKQGTHSFFFSIFSFCLVFFCL